MSKEFPMHSGHASSADSLPGFKTVPVTIGKMPGHWSLAAAGKRVLRPGGLALTRRMLDALAIGRQDKVVEFAPGLGVTAQMALVRDPSFYCGVEREPVAVERLARRFAGLSARFVQGEAQKSSLPDDFATVVFGEAMLSMQIPEQKQRIFAEARRLLAPGGRYGIHELCFVPDEISPAMRREIQAELSREIHVGVQPLSRTQWAALYEQNGMSVTWACEAPMHLLEPWRILADEGLRRGSRIVFNMLTKPELRKRILGMRRLFRKYGNHLGAISLVGILRQE
jgi:SAM-dependent methyltransferase